MRSIKKKLLDKCKELQQEKINNLKQVVDEAQKSANEYGTPKDRYDSFRTQMLRKKDMFAQQLLKANEQLDALNKINIEVEFESVEFGAMVITSSQKLFISIGLGKVELDGEVYYAISPLVPISQVLMGRKKGENFSFQGKENEIKDVY